MFGSDSNTSSLKALFVARTKDFENRIMREACLEFASNILKDAISNGSNMTFGELVSKLQEDKEGWEVLKELPVSSCSFKQVKGPRVEPVSESALIEYLKSNPDQTLGQIAKGLNVETGAVKPTIKSLEGKGLRKRGQRRSMTYSFEESAALQEEVQESPKSKRNGKKSNQVTPF